MSKLLKKLKKRLGYQSPTDKMFKQMRKSSYNRRYYLKNCEELKQKRRERYYTTGQ